MMQPSENLHDALKCLSWLAGSWSTTEGEGKYPTIQSFKYHETLEFLCVGQPMFNFTSTSKHPEKQMYMHQERGFLRIKPGTNNLSFIVSHNFGLATVEEGLYNPGTKEIILESVDIVRMSFAKKPQVKKLKRHIRLVAPEQLEVMVYMETEATPITEHLKALYKKDS